MSPEAAIYLIIWIVVILGGAWVLEYIASVQPDEKPGPRADGQRAAEHVQPALTAAIAAKAALIKASSQP